MKGALWMNCVFLLLAAALGYGIARLQGQGPGDPPTTPPPDTLETPPTPRALQLDPVILQPLMRERLNPALTAISFNLFHRNEEERDKNKIEAMAQQVIAGARELRQGLLDAGSALDSTPFDRYLNQLEDAAVQVRDTAHTGDHETQIHWFWHLSSSCMKCHDDYRF